MVGNPANTNALIAQACAPSIPKENFTALTRLDQNRAKGFLAKKLHVSPGQIHNAIIWGKQFFLCCQSDQKSSTDSPTWRRLDEASCARTGLVFPVGGQIDERPLEASNVPKIHCPWHIKSGQPCWAELTMLQQVSNQRQ